MSEDDFNKIVGSTHGWLTGYTMGKRLTVSELKQKNFGDIVWLRFKGGAISDWRIDDASEIEDVFDSNGDYFLSFIDYDYCLDKNLKESDMNSDTRYGEAYICEAIKK